ncbi:penicillin-binding protein 1C [Duganella sp. CF402]|uniref:penicillin-binding protein 1C n=1 Tax=unclassified Duganella TaxID=2636909 RepID=UPI0008B1CEFF|nr:MULTISPECIES: penicillin-binding protein 1C [unclassified Duganella]RZT09356.1 penicillin-binding protein 1C [Duganella sp. BK701]SEL60464.1 penicillin-binding protein 1C [Duganella sp. CF402]
MKLISSAIVLALAGANVHAVPAFDEVRAAYRSSDAELLDRHGVAIQSLRIDMAVRRLPWVALGDISPALPAAVLQAEDQRFYEHNGVDWSAAAKAAWDNLFRTRPRGASTITMQLAALLDPALQPVAKGRNWGQKWDQVTAARELDAQWSKQQIMEAYLNMVSYRGELQGVGAAARSMFGKAPSGLDSSESVILASLLRAPAAGQKMVAQRACSLAHELQLPSTCSEIQLRIIVAWSRPQLAGKLAPAPQVAQQLLTRSGQAVRSTLDGGLQRHAQAVLRQQLAALNGRNVNDGAVVVLENASGEILAYVGNAGGSDVDGVAALRQAGSTLKPFLYELALERKQITAASLMDDTAIDISTGSGMYAPQNYDKGYKGYVSARTSLASSLNVPAVRTLMMTGMERFHERLRDVGLSSLTQPAEYYGYSLALGSAEVSLLELANAYRVLANGGMYSAAMLAPQAAKAPQPRRVLDARAAFIVSDILADRAARSLTFGLKNELATTFWAAVKTGTSKDMRDNWCVGYSEKYTVGVWVGNFNGQSMWDVSGVSGAAPVWRDVMDYLHRSTASRAPKPPAGVVRQQIAYQPELESARGEWFIAGTESPLVTLVHDEHRAPKILYPGDASILALDPDIPDATQRVFFLAQGGQGLRWQLDGEPLAQASTDYAWRPTPGQHQLALIDANATPIATTRFQVRGVSQQ